MIETERLRLRAFEIEDAEWFFKVTHNDEVRKYLVGAYTRSLNEAKNSIRDYYSKGDFIHNFYFIIENKENHERFGFLDITQGWHKELEVAMFMAKQHRRKGYMIEALKGFIKYLPAGSVLKFCIDKENESSLIVTQRFEQIVETTSFCSKNLTEEFRFFILET